MDPFNGAELLRLPLIGWTGHGMERRVVRGSPAAYQRDFTPTAMSDPDRDQSKPLIPV